MKITRIGALLREGGRGRSLELSSSRRNPSSRNDYSKDRYRHRFQRENPWSGRSESGSLAPFPKYAVAFINARAAKNFLLEDLLTRSAIRSSEAKNYFHLTRRLRELFLHEMILSILIFNLLSLIVMYTNRFLKVRLYHRDSSL